MDDKYDIGIVGGGPGGYVAAIRGAQLKRRVVLFERDEVGGTCMNYGCIPTKYLLHQTKIFRDLKENKNIEGKFEAFKCNWKRIQEEKGKIVKKLVKGVEFLLKKNGVNVVKGKALLRSKNHIEISCEEGEKIFKTDKIILATGSRPADLPFLKTNMKNIITSREALELENIPRRLIIVGAGPIGLEMGTIFQRLGSDVSILEIMPTILPGSERDIIFRMERVLKDQGLKIFTQMRIEECFIKDGNIYLKGTCLKDQNLFDFNTDKILLATGRRPNSEDLKEALPELDLDEKGFVKVNSRFETSVPGVYAIGDLIGGKLLAHKALHEGIAASENASGLTKTVNYNALPMAVFSEPEFSSVGLSEQEAKERGIMVKTGLFSLQANGRALSMGSIEGAVKIIADEKEKIVGAHILAPNASELIAEMTLAIENGMTLQDVSSSIHIHPTLSESVAEAALKAQGKAIHIIN